MPTIIQYFSTFTVLKAWKKMPESLWYIEFYNELRGACSNCGHKLPTPKKFREKMSIDVRPVIPEKKASR